MDEIMEQVEEALGLISMALDETEDPDLESDLLEAVEILEDVTRQLGAGEMNDLMDQHRDNMEGMDDF